MLQVFAKAKTRINNNAFAAYPLLSQPGNTPGQVAVDLCHHILVLRGKLHGARLTLHMHEHHLGL